MERVECLYRVSTKGQVDHDDIPMQRIECRKFAESQGWIIIKELCEKGVSGFIAIFKNKANSRRNGTSLSSQKAKLSEKHIVSHLEGHPASSP